MKGPTYKRFLYTNTQATSLEASLNNIASEGFSLKFIESTPQGMLFIFESLPVEKSIQEQVKEELKRRELLNGENPNSISGSLEEVNQPRAGDPNNTI